MLNAIILSVITVIILLLIWSYRGSKRTRDYQLPPDAANLLEAHVAFYRKLDAANRVLFGSRIRNFLSHTKITGVGIIVSELDRLLVAASAIIPIAAFPTWQYGNIHELLLYPDTFNKEYATEGEGRNVLGMVGNGALNDHMILSQRALREGFAQEEGHNTAIHEFVHLIDKADGSVDGIPEYLLARPYVMPWVAAMHREIDRMRVQDTDINPYGATNDAEFFAVVSEYFFERPEALQETHPELFAMLSKMFDGKPAENVRL